MSDQGSTERALSGVVDRFASDLKRELLRELGGGAVGPGTALLCSGFKRIHGARNQTDIMQALLEAAEHFSGRCAVLVVKGDRLTGWRGRSLDDNAQGSLKQLSLAPDGNSGWKQALGSPDPLPKGLAQSFFEAVGAPADRTAYLLPLLVKERPVAMLYADAGAGEPIDREALELLTRTAGICLELTAARPRGEAAAGAAAAAPASALAEAAPEPQPEPLPMEAAPEPEPELPPPPPPPPRAPAPKRATGPDFDNIPPSDHDIHKKAFRFAKLLVDELLLYNKEKVAEGKRNRDVYSMLQEDIDKSRLAYEKKFGKTPAGKVDYFHQQIVQIIGDGDASVLGGGYPGPLA